MKRLVKLLFGAALIGLLLRVYPISASAVRDTFRSVDLLLLTLTALLLFNQYALSSLKRRRILESHGISLPFGDLLRSYLIGNFFSAFLPSSYGGDLVRVADVARRTGRTFESASAVVLERLSGLFALAVAGGAASLALAGHEDTDLFRNLAVLFFGVAAILAAGFVPVILRAGEQMARRAPLPVGSAFAKVAEAVRHYGSRPRLLLEILLISFTFQLLAYTIIYLYCRALHIPVSYVYCLAFVPVMYLLEALPISVAGLGLREGALIYFLTRSGYNSSQAISLSILILSMRYAMNLVGGVLFALQRSVVPRSARAGTAVGAGGALHGAGGEGAETGRGRAGGGSVLKRLQRLAARRLVPGVVVSFYYYARGRSIVHPRATVQLSRNMRLGRQTTIHPYSRIILSGGSITMGTFCNLQPFSTIAAGDSHVHIGDHVRIGPNCNLLGEDHRYQDRNTPIHRQGIISRGLVIEDDVWIGANSVILPGVTLGRGSIVGAGSVVTRSVDPFTIVAGNPARPIKTR